MTMQRVAMPPEIQETYTALSNHMVVIHARWTIYRQLFGTDPERIDLLNRFGGAAFGVIQRVMEDEAVFSLCRISDPPAWGTGKKARANVTFKRLVNLVSVDQPKLEVDLKKLLADLDGIRDACMNEIRNRVLGHLDLATVAHMNAGNPGPARPNRANVEAFLAKAGQLLNAVQTCYENGTTYYGPLNLGIGNDGDALVEYLRELAARMDADPSPDARLKVRQRIARAQQRRIDEHGLQ
jgi:hypothetical protein